MPNVLPLSSTAQGVVNAGQLADIQAVVDGLKTNLDAYNTAYTPVKSALDDFNIVRGNHQVAIDAASAARSALNAELFADANYHAKKAVLDAARLEPDYISARAIYVDQNVSENIVEITQAKGSYQA